MRVAVGLRLGIAVCGLHNCHFCGTAVDVLGRHALRCRHSEGSHQRHACMQHAVNDILKRSLSAVRVPSWLEPTGLLGSDGGRPDGVTLAPWKCGCLLVWDATCPDTFAAEQLVQSLYQVLVATVIGGNSACVCTGWH